jgi:RNA polymerase sigma-70 factor (ECF subfamily)
MRLAILKNSAPNGAELGEDPELGLALEEVIASARAEWQGIEVADELFIPYLASRLQADVPPAASLRSLRASDLYLACACANGDSAAAAWFQEIFNPAIEIAIRFLDPSSGMVDDIKQIVFLKVFVGEEPKIGQYSGRASFRKWIQVIAVRTAQNMLRSRAKERQLPDEVLEGLAPQRSSELANIKRLYKDHFDAAFREAVGALTSRERNLLRYRWLERMAVEQIAKVYSVHRMTITRWMAALRHKLLDHTKDALTTRLSARESEVYSVMRLVQSQLDLSIRRFLVSEDPPPE